MNSFPLVHPVQSRVSTHPVLPTFLTPLLGREQAVTAVSALLAQREMALLAVPLVAREQLWGVITLARAVPFETGNLRIMLTLSQMIAQALAQTRDAR